MVSQISNNNNNNNVELDEKSSTFNSIQSNKGVFNENLSGNSNEFSNEQVISFLMSSENVLILYEIKTHPFIKFFVVHDIPLDMTNSGLLRAKDLSMLKDIKLPPVVIYNNTILFYHISYFQHCLKQQDLFVTYVNGYLKAMKENILMRNEMNQLLIQKKIYKVTNDYLKDNEKKFVQNDDVPSPISQEVSSEKNGSNQDFSSSHKSEEDSSEESSQSGKSKEFGHELKQKSLDIDNNQVNIDNWIHATVDFALERLDFVTGRENMESIIDSLKIIDLNHDTHSSVKQLVLDHGLQYLTTNYAIDLFWPWKDVDLIVCVRNEKLFMENFLRSPDANTSNALPWSQDYMQSITGLRQTRCLVMDHNSKIRAITHDYPIPVHLSPNDSKQFSKENKDSKKGNFKSKESIYKSLIQERILECYILDNMDGFICTIFYEQGEWLMVSGDSFRGRFTNERSNSNPMFSNPSLALDPIISESATVTRIREKHLGPKEMSEMFWGTFYESGYEMPSDINCCYTFILQLSQYPKHVYCEEDKLYLVSVHNIKNDTHLGRNQIIIEKDIFQVSRELEYQVPKRHSFRNIDEVYQSLRDLNPLEGRGYIVLVPLREEDESRITSNDSLRFEKSFDRYLLDSSQFISSYKLKNFHELDSDTQLSVIYDLICSGFAEQILNQMKFRTEAAKDKSNSIYKRLKKKVESCSSTIQKVYDSHSSLQKKEFTKVSQEYPFSNILNEMKRNSHNQFMEQYLKYDITSFQHMKTVIQNIEKYQYDLFSESFDYLVVIDFEATCDEGEKPSITPENQEIIEFPLAIIDLSRTQTEEEAKNSNFEYNIVYKRRYYVRPTESKNLTSFCTKLTGITWNELKNASTLSEVLLKVDQDLKEQIPIDKKFCIICDGQWDIKLMLFRETQRKAILLPDYYYRFFNIKEEVRKEYPRKMTNSLKVMAKGLGVPLYGRHHSGIDDCISITRIINSLITKSGHKFTNPIIIEEDYRPEMDTSTRLFDTKYVPGPWICLKCKAQLPANKYSCSICRSKRPTITQLKAKESMNNLIELAFKFPKKISTSTNSKITKASLAKNTFIKIFKSGFLGIVFFLIMKRLEPNRRRLWEFISLVMMIVSYISNWPNFSQENDS